ncbi:PREDICTED: probable inactive receptor kinase At5g67200 [Camelina sativa]|uniref:Probable inactive receptor kinase At5g67200 n=1 Tax=Camelina sativa TaxID=90675 RepID=A0ABM0YNP0_CAMSA|nr:PREDICTED: probable inactive receptor kinase At5g67200 [Camelina sativa]
MLCSVKQNTHKMTLFFYSLLFLFHLLLRISAAYPSPATNYFDSFLPTDAVALLSFKSTADLDNKLLYSLTEPYDYCQWRGVECSQDRVVRLLLDGVGLRGRFSPETLTRLDQLRVLNLENNSISGSVPDLSPLTNLRSLTLSKNHFSGTLSGSILSLRRLAELDLSYNNFSGEIPSEINALSQLSSLHLEFNRFNGTLPPLNHSSLTSFNVSGNNLTGLVPVTTTLLRFNESSFSSNPGLCGEIINKSCGSRSSSPFFGSTKPNATSSSSSSSSSQAPVSQPEQNGEATMTNPPPVIKKVKNGWLILGFTIGLASLIVLGLCLVMFSLVMKNRRDGDEDVMITQPSTVTEPLKSQKREEENKEINIQFQEPSPQKRIPRSGDLIFCGDVEGEGEAMYTLDQLMRASAELLGRGSVGTTYKAVMVNQMIVTVKRFAPSKTAITSDLAFENQMEIVGGLRHPNLVPVKAYFQSNGERLVIYDYQPNGSLFNLIHGSRTSKAKPLHWTSCLKIAEDVAQALHYIHQSSAHFHGNLKSTNILLGHDFEACLTDYCLSVLTDSSVLPNDPDLSSYKAPEIRKSTDSRRPTSKCDVYSFGVFLLELLTGKTASRQPFMEPEDMLDWVRAMRQEEERSKEENGLEMMTQTACLCRVTSPEQRPTMNKVIKMIQEIKESVVMSDDNDKFL